MINIERDEEQGQYDQRSAAEFFVAGGTLRRHAASYIERAADDELLDRILAGHFCYLLTARQMGKSSLMVRTADVLESRGIKTAIIDLTKLGTNISAEQWYLGLLKTLTTQLELKVRLEDWWQTQAGLSPVLRFSNFLHEILLAEIPEQITIFIDEIDSTLNLPFSDDFFAAIRAVYNARASDPDYNRLTFVLLGVATPSDLMKDRSRTPFNVGYAINLREFDRQEANTLENALEVHLSEQGSTVFNRIFHWTNGHPYLTQRLCLTVAQSPQQAWDHASVDKLVESLFLSEAARGETNLQFIRDKITDHPQKRAMLTMYRRILAGQKIEDDERSIIQNQLKLIGLVRVENETLEIRNQLYRQVFNQAWIKSVKPVNWARRAAVVAVIIVLVLAAGLFYALRQGEQQTEEVLAQRAIDTFQSEQSNAILRLNSLNDLFALNAYNGQARSLFLDLPPNEQLSLFTRETAELAEQKRHVVQGISVLLDNDPSNTDLLGAMQFALENPDFPENQNVADAIEFWLDGRSNYEEGNFDQAIQDFNDAIKKQNNNPAIYFDRGQAYLARSDYQLALEDFDATLSQSSDADVFEFWSSRVADVIVGNPQLHATWWQQRSNYSALTEVVKTPTPTPTPTTTPTPTNTFTPNPTETPTPEPTSTSTPTHTPTSTNTSTPTNTPTATFRPFTWTPSPVSQATNTSAPQPNSTSTPQPNNTWPWVPTSPPQATNTLSSPPTRPFTPTPQ